MIRDVFAVAKSRHQFKKNSGSFLKPCPCTPRHTCCGYNFLNIATNCPIDCTYCILQDYLGPEPITIHSNTDDMLDELETALSDSGRFLRIGTGELTDSLAIDRITGYSRELVPFFSSRKNAVLELKTKTDFTDNLVGLDHGRRTVVAWSLNPAEIVNSEEHGGASVENRIRAALKCQDEGYRLAFHFDPIVDHPEWRKGYADLISALTGSGVKEENVAWISMGCTRFVPEMRNILAERFPESAVRKGEFVKGVDGKLRYFKPIRIKMYRALAECIRRNWPGVLIYLCMENRDVWDASLGWSPTSDELALALNDEVRQI